MLDELIWKFGVLVWSNLPWVALLWVGRRHPAVLAAAVPESGPAGPRRLAAVLAALYVGDLLLLWLTLAHGDVALLDRAVIVVLISTLAFGRPALTLIPAALAIRAAIALLDGVPEPLSGVLSAQPWRLLDLRLYWEHAWLWHDPGVVSILVAGMAALAARRLAAGRDRLPWWSLILPALLTEGAYLATAWFDWPAPAVTAYALDESWANLLGLILSLLLWRLLWRGIRADWQQARLQALALTQARQRLSLLQQRIKPHFLFNALNSIHALIRRDPEQARRRLLDLSELMRALIGEADERVPLGSELGLVRAYLNIEQVRYGDRLRVHIAVPADLEKETVPGLMLQPLVENAVRHGLAPKPEGGNLWIRAAEESDRLILDVEDDGMGLETGVARSPGNGQALANSRERLRLLYGPAAGLELSAGSRGGVRARLTLPRHAIGEDRG